MTSDDAVRLLPINLLIVVPGQQLRAAYRKPSALYRACSTCRYWAKDEVPDVRLSKVTGKCFHLQVLGHLGEARGVTDWHSCNWHELVTTDSL